jgi:hypothetical protein
MIALGKCRVQEIRGSHVAFRGFSPKENHPASSGSPLIYGKSASEKPDSSENGAPVLHG